MYKHLWLWIAFFIDRILRRITDIRKVHYHNSQLVTKQRLRPRNTDYQYTSPGTAYVHKAHTPTRRYTELCRVERGSSLALTEPHSLSSPLLLPLLPPCSCHAVRSPRVLLSLSVGAIAPQNHSCLHQTRVSSCRLMGEEPACSAACWHDACGAGPEWL